MFRALGHERGEIQSLGVAEWIRDLQGCFGDVAESLEVYRGYPWRGVDGYMFRGWLKRITGGALVKIGKTFHTCVRLKGFIQRGAPRSTEAEIENQIICVTL